MSTNTNEEKKSEEQTLRQHKVQDKKSSKKYIYSRNHTQL